MHRKGKGGVLSSLPFGGIDDEDDQGAIVAATSTASVAALTANAMLLAWIRFAACSAVSGASGSPSKRKIVNIRDQHDVHEHEVRECE